MFVFIFSKMPLLKIGQMYLNFLSAQSGLVICIKRFVIYLQISVFKNRIFFFLIAVASLQDCHFRYLTVCIKFLYKAF